MSHHRYRLLVGDRANQSQVETLVFGWPGLQHALPELNNRVSWWPRGLPNFQAWSLVSSRLEGGADRHDHAFEVLRKTCAQLDPSRHGLLSVQGTTLARFLPHAASRFGLPWIDVHFPGHRETLESWLRRLHRGKVPGGLAPIAPGCFPCFLSPLPDSSDLERSKIPPASSQSIPLRDLLSVFCAPLVLVLHLRLRGNLAGALARRLRIQQGGVRFALTSKHPITSPQARRWLVRGVAEPRNSHLFIKARHPPRAEIISLPRSDKWNYLLHWTRLNPDRWPDQSEAEYVDDLLYARPGRLRTPLKTLLRILRMEQILATGETIRGGSPVVSFTAVALSDLQRLHTFRKHRHRWDFEPYGICLSRTLLQGLGTRPVIYGNEACWRNLDRSQRPWFQKETSCDGKVDWRVEQEWRHPGDLDLKKIADDAGFVLVPSFSEAEDVARWSRWPVAVLPL